MGTGASSQPFRSEGGSSGEALRHNNHQEKKKKQKSRGVRKTLQELGGESLQFDNSHTDF